MFNVWRMEIKRLRLQIKGPRSRSRVCSEFNEIHPQNKSYANKFSLTRKEERERQNERESVRERERGVFVCQINTLLFVLVKDTDMIQREVK